MGQSTQSHSNTNKINAELNPVCKVRPSVHPPQKCLMAQMNVNLILMQMSHILLNQVELWLNPIEWICKCSCCCHFSHFRVEFVKVSIIGDVLIYRFNHVCCTKYNFVKTMPLKLGPTANAYKLVRRYRKQKTGFDGLMETNEN